MPKAHPYLRTEQGDKFLSQIFNNDTGIKQKGECEQALCLIYDCS